MENDKVKKEFSAGLIVYRNTPKGPKFLLLYHGGRYWNFPKGHIEDQKNIITSSIGGVTEINTRETSIEAAIRETQEETGISSDKLSIKNNFKAVERFQFKKNREQIFKVVIFYLAETTETEIKISPEHEGFGWFQYKDAKHLFSIYKDSQRLLRNAYEYIRPKPVLRPRLSSPKRQNDSRQSPLKPFGQA